MPAPRRFLGEQAQTVETRAAAMRKPLEQWLERYAARARADALRRLREGSLDSITKAAPPDYERLALELRELLARYGLRQLQQAAETGAATIGAEVSLTDQLVLEFFEQKEIKVVEIMEATQRASQNAIRQIMTEALTEAVRPSTTEIGRRLMNRLRFGSTVDGAASAFSPERAQLIARTEMVQAQNTGIVNGYRLAGIRRHRWIAYDDGRSGRGHDVMGREKQTREIGEPFETPDGTLPNCRCTTVPVVSPAEA